MAQGASIKEYVIKVTADVKQAQQELDKLGKGFEKITISKAFTDAVQSQTDAVTGSLGKITQELSGLQKSVSSVSTALAGDIKQLMGDLNTSINTLEKSFKGVTDVFKNFSGNDTTGGLANSFENFNKQIDQMITSYNSIMEKFSGAMAQGSSFSVPSSNRGGSASGAIQKVIENQAKDAQVGAEQASQQTSNYKRQTKMLEEATKEYREYYQTIKEAANVVNDGNYLDGRKYSKASNTVKKLLHAVDFAKNNNAEWKINDLQDDLFTEKELKTIDRNIDRNIREQFGEVEKESKNIKTDVRTLPVRFVVQTDIELDEKSEDGKITSASKSIVDKIQNKIQNEVQKEISKNPIRIPIDFTAFEIDQDGSPKENSLQKLTDEQHKQKIIESIKVRMDIVTDGILDKINDTIKSITDNPELKQIEIPVVPKEINTHKVNEVASNIIDQVEDNLKLTGRDTGIPVAEPADVGGLATEQTLQTRATEATLQSILNILSSGNPHVRSASPNNTPPGGGGVSSKQLIGAIQNQNTVISSNGNADLQQRPSSTPPGGTPVERKLDQIHQDIVQQTEKQNTDGATSQQRNSKERSIAERYAKIGLNTAGKVSSKEQAEAQHLRGSQSARLSVLGQQRTGLNELSKAIKKSDKKDFESLMPRYILDSYYTIPGSDTKYATYGGNKKIGILEPLETFRNRLIETFDSGQQRLLAQEKVIENEFANEHLMDMAKYTFLNFERDQDNKDSKKYKVIKKTGEREQWKKLLIEHQDELANGVLKTQKSTENFLKKNKVDFNRFAQANKDSYDVQNGVFNTKVITDKPQQFPKDLVEAYVREYYRSVQNQIEKADYSNVYEKQLSELKKTRIKQKKDSIVKELLGEEQKQIDSQIKSVAENLKLLDVRVDEKGNVEDFSKISTTPEEARKQMYDILNRIRERAMQKAEPYRDMIAYIDENRDDLNRFIELSSNGNHSQNETIEFDSLKEKFGDYLTRWSYTINRADEIDAAIETLTKSGKRIKRGTNSDKDIDKFLAANNIINEQAIQGETYSDADLSETAKLILDKVYNEANFEFNKIKKNAIAEQYVQLGAAIKKGRLDPNFNKLLLRSEDNPWAYKNWLKAYEEAENIKRYYEKMMLPKSTGGFDTTSLPPYGRQEYIKAVGNQRHLSTLIGAYEARHEMPKVELAADNPNYKVKGLDQKGSAIIANRPTDIKSLGRLSSTELKQVLSDMEYVLNQLTGASKKNLTDDEIHARALEMTNKIISDQELRVDALKKQIDELKSKGIDTDRLERNLNGQLSFINQIKDREETAISIKAPDQGQDEKHKYKTVKISELQNELEQNEKDQKEKMNALRTILGMTSGDMEQLPKLVRNLETLQRDEQDAFSQYYENRLETNNLQNRLASLYKNDGKASEISKLESDYEFSLGLEDSYRQAYKEAKDKTKAAKNNIFKNYGMNNDFAIEDWYKSIAFIPEETQNQLGLTKEQSQELGQLVLTYQDYIRREIDQKNQVIDDYSEYQSALVGIENDINQLYQKEENGAKLTDLEKKILNNLNDRQNAEYDREEQFLDALSIARGSSMTLDEFKGKHGSVDIKSLSNLFSAQQNRGKSLDKIVGYLNGVSPSGTSYLSQLLLDTHADIVAPQEFQSLIDTIITLQNNHDYIEELLSSALEKGGGKNDNYYNRIGAAIEQRIRSEQQEISDWKVLAQTYISTIQDNNLIGNAEQREQLTQQKVQAKQVQLEAARQKLEDSLKSSVNAEDESSESAKKLQEQRKAQQQAIKAENAKKLEKEQKDQEAAYYARHMQAVDKNGVSNAEKKNSKFLGVQGYSRKQQQYSQRKPANHITNRPEIIQPPVSSIQEYLEYEQEMDESYAAAEQYFDHLNDYIDNTADSVHQVEKRVDVARRQVDNQPKLDATLRDSISLTKASSKEDYIDRINRGLSFGMRLGKNQNGLSWAKSTDILQKNGFKDLTSEIQNNEQAINKLADSYYKLAGAKKESESLKLPDNKQPEDKKSSKIRRSIAESRDFKPWTKEDFKSEDDANKIIKQGAVQMHKDTPAGRFWKESVENAKAYLTALEQVRAAEVQQTNVPTDKVQQAHEATQAIKEQAEQTREVVNTQAQEIASDMASVDSSKAQANANLEQAKQTQEQANQQKSAQNTTVQPTQTQSKGIATSQGQTQSQATTLPGATAEPQAFDQLATKLSQEIPAAIDTKNAAFIAEAELVNSLATQEAQAFDQLVDKLEKIAGLATNFKFDFQLSGADQLNQSFIENLKLLITEMQSIDGGASDKVAALFNSLGSIKFNAKQGVGDYFKDLASGVQELQKVLGGDEISSNFGHLSDLIAKISNAGNALKDMAVVMKGSSKIDDLISRYSTDAQDNKQIKDLLKEYEFLANPKNVQKATELGIAERSGKLLNTEDSTWLNDYQTRQSAQTEAFNRLKNQATTLQPGFDALNNANNRFLANQDAQKDQQVNYRIDYTAPMNKAIAEVQSNSQALSSQFSSQINDTIESIRAEFARVDSKEIGLDEQKQNVKNIVKQFNAFRNQHANHGFVGQGVGGNIVNGEAVGVEGVIQSWINNQGYKQIRDISGGTVNANGIATFATTVVDADKKVKELKFTWSSLNDAISVTAGTQRSQFASGFIGMLTELQAKSKQLFTYWTANLLNPYRMIGYVKQQMQTVKQFDTALTEMRKVSDEPLSVLQKYQQDTFNVADSIGTTSLTIQNSTADWMRLGESIDKASESAKSSSILFNVSEFENINDATKALVSMSQAYQDLGKMEIIDKVNNIGNNFSISTNELATGLQNAAAVLKTQGNDIDQAIALLTAGNAVTQDISKTSAGIRTISLRIAGTEEQKKELSEMGEDAEDFVIRTRSKTDEIIRKYTAVKSNNYEGISVLDSNGNLRSTYDILLDISKIYKEIQQEDKQYGTNRQQALVENLAGKTRSNIQASILDNPEMLQSVYETSLNSAGSAEAELSKYLDSINGKLEQSSNKIQEIIAIIADSDSIKMILDIFNQLLDGINSVIKAAGGLPQALGVLSTVFMSKHRLGLFNFDKKSGLFGSAYPFGGAILNALPAQKVPVTVTGGEYGSWINYQTPDNGQLYQPEIFSYGSVAVETGFAELADQSDETAQALAQIADSADDVPTVITPSQSAGFLGALKNIGLGQVSGIATSILMTLAMKGIGAIIKGADRLFNSKKYDRQAGEEADQNIKNIRKDQQEREKYVNDNLDRFIELRKGVSESGANISLPTEEYQEYLEISQQLATYLPNLSRSFDAQGNMLLSLSGDADQATTSIQNLLEQQKKLTAASIIEQIPDSMKNALNNMDDDNKNIKKQQKEYDNYIRLQESVDTFMQSDDLRSAYADWISDFVDFDTVDQNIVNRVHDAFDSAIAASYDVDPDESQAVFEDKFRTSLNSIKSSITTSLVELESELTTSQNSFDSTWQEQAQNLITSLYGYYDFGQLSKSDLGGKVQDLISKQITNLNPFLDLSEEDFGRFKNNSVDFVYDQIAKPLINAYNDPDKQIKLDQLFNLDLEHLTNQESRDKVDQLCQDIFGENWRDGEVAIGFMFKDEKGDYHEYQHQRLNKIKEQLGGDESKITKDELDTLDQTQQKAIESVIGEVDLKKFDSLDQLLKWLDSYQKKVEEAKQSGTLADIFNMEDFDVSPFEDKLSAIDTALSSLRENGELTAEEQLSLQKQIPDLTDFSLESISDKGLDVLGDYIDKMREYAEAADLGEEGTKQFEKYLSNLAAQQAMFTPSMEAAQQQMRDSIITATPGGADYAYQSGQYYSYLNALKDEYGEDLDMNVIAYMSMEDMFSGSADEVLQKYEDAKVYVDLELGENNLDKAIREQQRTRTSSLLSLEEQTRQNKTANNITLTPEDYDASIFLQRQAVNQARNERDKAKENSDTILARYNSSEGIAKQKYQEKWLSAESDRIQKEQDLIQQETELTNLENEQANQKINPQLESLSRLTEEYNQLDEAMKQLENHGQIVPSDMSNRAGELQEEIAGLNQEIGEFKYDRYRQTGNEEDYSSANSYFAQANTATQTAATDKARTFESTMTQYSNQLTDLQNSASAIQEDITLREGRGLIPTLNQYAKLLNNGEAQIQNLKDQNFELRKQQRSVKDNQAEYRKYGEQIRANNAAISSMQGNMQGWSDAIKSYAETVGTNLASALQQAISESFSDTGLTANSMKQLQAQFEGLGDGDFSEIFYNTANGVKLDMLAVQKLVKAQQGLVTGDLTRRIKSQNSQLSQLKTQYKNAADAAEKMKIASQIDASESGLENLYNQLAQYQAQYAQAMKEFTKLADFQRAQSSANAGDNYKTLQGYLETQEKAWESGEIGTDEFKTYAAMYDEWGRTSVEAYTKNRDKIKRYVTEDSTGVANFYDDLVKAGYGTYDAETGMYDMDIPSIDKAAHALGIGAEFAEYVFGRAEDFGFYNDFVRDQIDGELKLMETEHDLAEAIAHKYDLMRQGAPQDVIDEANAEIERLDQRVVNLRENTNDVIASANTITSEQIQSAVDVLGEYKKNLDSAQSDAERNTWQKAIKDFAEQNHIPITFDYDVDTAKLDEMFAGWDERTPKLKLGIDSSTLSEAGYAEGQFSKQYSHGGQTVVMTPVLPDGTVMDANSFGSYVQNVARNGVEQNTEGLFMRVFDGENAQEEARAYGSVLDTVSTKLSQNEGLAEQLTSQLGDYTFEQLSAIDYADGKLDASSAQAEQAVDAVMRSLGLSSEQAQQFIQVLSDMGVVASQVQGKEYNLSLNVETGTAEQVLKGTKFEGATQFDAMSMSAAELSQKISELNQAKAEINVETEGGEKAQEEIQALIDATQKQYEIQVGVEKINGDMGIEEFLGLTRFEQEQYMAHLGIDRTDFDQTIKACESQSIQAKVDVLVEKEGLETLQNLSDEDLRKKLEVEFDGDTSKIDEAMEKIRSMEGEEIPLKIRIDDEQFNNLLSSISGSQNQTPINIAINTAAAVQSLAAITASLTVLRLQALAPINITVKTESSVEQVNNLKDAIKELEDRKVNVGANVTGRSSVDNLSRSISALQGKSVYISVLMGNALSQVANLRSELNSLQSKTIYLTTVKTTIGGASGSMSQSQARRNVGGGKPIDMIQAAGTLNAHASGTMNAYAGGSKKDVQIKRNEDALVNEVANESIIRNGQWFVIPGGPHVEHLKKGDKIFVPVYGDIHYRTYLIAEKPLESYKPQRSHEIQASVMV